MWDAFINHLQSEGAVLINAPILIALIAGIIWYVVWRMMEWKYAARLAMKEDQIADLKAKLEGRSVDAIDGGTF